MPGSMVSTRLRRWAFVVALIAPACLSRNTASDLEATHKGDLSAPPAERGDEGAALARACGGGATVSAYAFWRKPYLQRVTAGSARLMWAAAPEPRPVVMVSTPGGGAATEVVAERDEGATPAGGGAVAWRASLEALSPDTVYCYELRAGGATSGRRGFRTAPAAGAGRSVRFVAFGDSGKGGPDQKALLSKMVTVPFDLLVHTGDLAYSHGTRDELQRRVFDVYAGVFEQFAFFPASGNHEYDTEGAAPFREAFALPENGGPEGRERWYSFDWGDAHFVALDTERIGPTQAAWLEADLAANRLPWTIVYGHRPPFSSGEHGGDAAFRRHFVPVLERHRVALVLSGHEHNYERTKPWKGVNYVVTGGGGIGTRPVGRSTFTAFSESVIHFVYVTVASDQLVMHAIDGVGNEFDSLVIRR